MGKLLADITLGGKNMTTIDPLRKLQFEELVSRYRNQLIGALANMLERAELEEVIQEASLRVYLHLDTIEPPALKTYWFRTARNLAITRRRHEQVIKHFSADLNETMLDQQARTDLGLLYEEREARAILIDAINKLPPVCRNVFLFRKIDGYSKQEIADLLGISVHTVDNHLTHGMKLCRRYVLEALSAGADHSFLDGIEVA